MAFHLPLVPTFFSVLFLFSVFVTPSHSSCADQKLSRKLDNCTDLPTLNATLSYSYNAANRTLSVAYSAAPPSPTGWVAWALNLAGSGMIGAQALIAIPQSGGGAVAVKRYNLTSYKGVDEVKAFTFDSWDLSAEHSNGVVTIFAVVKLPDGANVTQVWQVGPTEGGKVRMHAVGKENLASKAQLPVALGPAANTTGGGNATAPAPTSGEKAGAHKTTFGVGFYFSLVFAFMLATVTL